LLGGVTIPERHFAKQDEHKRVIEKMNNGCRFFISQGVYDLQFAKNFLSDYYYYCQEKELEMAPIIFTFTPCGSKKTLEFMKWLGIKIPGWLENDLLNSEDILDRSINQAKQMFKELVDYAQEKEIPIGCNIESVSIRKEEIEASIELLKDVKEYLE
jgi:5,10-methylenetetrahydrofolate reductase